MENIGGLGHLDELSQLSSMGNHEKARKSWKSMEKHGKAWESMKRQAEAWKSSTCAEKPVSKLLHFDSYFRISQKFLTKWKSFSNTQTIILLLGNLAHFGMCNQFDLLFFCVFKQTSTLKWKIKLIVHPEVCEVSRKKNNCLRIRKRFPLCQELSWNSKI